MRFLCVAAALALAACGRPAPAPHIAAPGVGCTREYMHRVAFSDVSAPDTITARAEGPSCAQAVVTLTIRAANGDPLWVFAETYAVMQGGEAASRLAPAAIDRLDEFLMSWADVTIKTTGDLPEWRAEAATLAESVQGMSYATPFDRDSYERFRRQNLRDLCFAVGPESSQCIIMDPASHAPSLIVNFGA
ncbi:MAG TPA: hypothetical protein VG841_12915 [Caulobacterales bacterium]|nr:hypothetical protein [Caulobacterales bacterium]